MIDTHCHLYSEEFKYDIEAVMQRGIDIGIKRIYMPAIDSTHTDTMLEIEKRYPDLCYSMMGLHPCSVNNKYQDELNHVEEWICKKKFAAIGEVGLDFYWDTTYAEFQYYAFRKQADWAIHYKLPLVIHSRNATPETIAVIQEFGGKDLRGIFHCFGGTLQEAKEIIDAGFYLGIGGIITYKNSGLAEVIREIPMEHIVLETDAPYLAPVPFRGKRNECSYLLLIAEKISVVKNIPVEEVIKITTDNAFTIFQGRYLP
ncbi:MAG: TatD family hydrolase [Ferruginibacter sp.]